MQGSTLNVYKGLLERQLTGNKGRLISILERTQLLIGTGPEILNVTSDIFAEAVHNSLVVGDAYYWKYIVRDHVKTFVKGWQTVYPWAWA